MGELKKLSWKVRPTAGSFDNLQWVEEDSPAPGEGEVLVEVKAYGLNFADIFAIFGLYSATPKGEFVPGLEFSGIISKVGSGVTTFKEGDRVMGVSRFGAYTNLLISRLDYVVPLPDDWTFEEGAAYLVQVLTAYYALVELGNIKKGYTVLVQSAAGGVGIWAGRIAKKFGAYTIGTVGNGSKLKVLEKEGYDKGIVRDEATFGQQLNAALDGRELNLVLECIGGKILMDSYKAMAMEGRLVVYGSAHYAHPGPKPNRWKLLVKYLKRPKLDPQKMIEQNKGVMGFNLIYLFNHAEKMEKYLAELKTMQIGKPVVGHVYPMTETRKALELFLSGKTTGKVVILT